ncbi:MAG: hypothetical protein C4310_06835, partial [Chloroflexota bacterium]
AYELIRRLVHAAAQYGADLLATICPMCQLNLDVYQGEMNRYFDTNYRMPILFFTQLMGVAYGLEPKALGLGQELVDGQDRCGGAGGGGGAGAPAAQEGGPAHATHARRGGDEP